MNSIKKRAVFTILTLLLVIVFLEVVLNIFAYVSPKVDKLLASPWVSRTVPDDRLLIRPNPILPEHDSKGFRNPEVPATADVVALGDSQTYGAGVKSDEAWPMQLKSMTGKTVYSMAHGSYGPVHSLILWDEATAFSPEIIIEAVYAGNDLFESFNLVYNHDQHVELKSPDPQVQSSVRELEDFDPLAKRAAQMFKRGATDKPATPRVSHPSLASLSQQSKIYALLRRLQFESSRFLSTFRDTPRDPWENAKVFAEKHPERTRIFNNEQFRTIFTSRYRLLALDLDDPRIAEGNKIILRAIQRMKENTADTNTRFIVVLIPTKELVFHELWSNPTSTYRDLAENELAFWKITKDFLEVNGIEYVDALPALREKLAFGVQPYPVSKDGHPNEHGHNAIANLIAAYLKINH